MTRNMLCALLLCCITTYACAQTKPHNTSASKPQKGVSTAPKAVATADTLAPVVFQVLAGSRAPWGTDQNLTIDSLGRCDFRLIDAERGVTDSARFRLPPGQVDSLLKSADKAGFFKLDSNYVKGHDGSGIYMVMNYGARIYSVNVVNESIPQIHTIVATLNGMLQPHKIRINY